MKIKSENFEEYIKKNYEDYKVIFFYGSNLGFIDLLYKKSIELLDIDINDPFNISKIDGTELKDNPFILENNINTLNIFAEKKFILLNLSYIPINKNIENIVLKAIDKKDVNYLLIIKAGNIGSQNKLVKYFENSSSSVVTVCYEENTNKIKNDISNIFKKHKLFFTSDFISQISSTFNSDSLSNKMEIEKLDSFLIDNNNVTEDVLLKFVVNNENINLTKVVNSCTKGETKESMFYLEKIYEMSNSNIILIRMFGKHFKIIEKILLLNQHGETLSEALNNLKPPIFFKEKSFFLSQCKMWSFKKLNLIQKRLINLEIKTKLGLYPEKTLLSQFILSTSVLAKKKIIS